MTSELFLVRLKNGQITQFNIRTKRAIYTSDVGHSRQIQRAQIHPNDCNVMASAGFDGSVRKWNLKNMQMELSFEDRKAKLSDKLIWSLAWCKMIPPQGQNNESYLNLVVIGTAAGNVKLVDLGRNKVLQAVKVSEGLCDVFVLDWNLQGLLAVGTSENVVLLKKLDQDTTTMVDVSQIQLYSACRCISWNPLAQNLMALGLLNGQIVIYDTERREITQTL